tara:strand:+ start:64 stop:1008 length:945 start_codon:yes stop_codon:yes gene_type:complete
MNNPTMIIGTGNMARTYFRHFRYLDEKCYMLFRNKYSENYKKALDEFGESSLLNITEAQNQNINLLLSCVGHEDHLKSIKDLKNKAKLTAIEKPISLNLKEIEDFDSKESTFVLMNRRYYSWVQKVKELIENDFIRKIIINIPENKNNSLWCNMPSSLITNSIHVFDLIYFLCDRLDSPIFKKIDSDSAFFFLKTKRVEEVIFNLDYKAIENFTIKFYLKDNSIIQCSPIEKASIYKTFRIIEPNKSAYIRQFIPISTVFTEEKVYMDYQKPGIINLCQDLLSQKDDQLNNDLKLPNIVEAYKIMNWLREIFIT